MRIESCQCRGFRVVVEAEPDIVGICHCQFCQRRTGVPLTCNAYFPKAKVRLEGEHRIYTRDCPERRITTTSARPAAQPMMVRISPRTHSTRTRRSVMRPGQAGNYNAISMTYVFAVLFRPARHPSYSY